MAASSEALTSSSEGYVGPRDTASGPGKGFSGWMIRPYVTRQTHLRLLTFETRGRGVGHPLFLVD